MQYRTKTLLVTLMLVLVASQAFAVAGAKPGVRAGYYFDPEAFFIGAEADINLTMLHFNPNIEWAFADGFDIWTFNADGYWTLPMIPATDTWIGGGLAWVLTNPENFDSSNDIGVNILAGIALNLPLNPYAQLKYLIVDNGNGFVFAIGARF